MHVLAIFNPLCYYAAMISKIYSSIPTGFTGHIVEVEADIGQGLPSFNIVGMGSKSITESKERVRSSLKSAGFSFPDSRLTVNLAPASLPKEGAFLDLPIALSVLTASRQLLPSDTEGALFIGELSLDGQVRPIPGIINIIEAAKSANITTVYLPLKNLAQAQLISDIDLIGVSSLEELFLHLKGQKLIESPTTQDVVKNTKKGVKPVIFDDIQGQDFAKRALTIALAGHHNIIFTGPPGTGKTQLAHAACSLLPQLSQAEQIITTKLYSLSNVKDTVITERPFRAPHHSCSAAAFIGSPDSPGEISLAHTGVLFLDELPEYPRNLLEALRQPLEDKSITVSRLKKQSIFPANFMLIATMNPCLCGYLGDPLHECTCSISQIQHYRRKLSGPLLDRIDLYVPVDRLQNFSLTATSSTSEHAAAKFLINKAHAHEYQRYQSRSLFNAHLSSSQITKYCHLEKSAEDLLKSATEKLGLSARSYFKIIKVAQTIADLDNFDKITDAHIAEALSYRHRE